MFLKLFVLFLCVVLGDTAYEGDQCVKDGVLGVCTNLKKCQSAIQDRKLNKNPEICSFDNLEPIVCCVDRAIGSSPASSNPSNKPGNPRPILPPPVRPATVSTEDYEEEDDEDGECAPLSPTMTVQKTGRKAFDKCIEYQEQLVYPCEKAVSLLGGVGRSNYCHHNADELIIGGVDAAQYEFPHMVMLGYGTQLSDLDWLCGGSLISERFILTAGHCIATRETNVSHVLIGALKRSERTDKSKIYKVKNIIKHPQYKSPIKYHDIALLELERPIKLDQFTVPACIHTGEPVNDTEVLATGWGHTQSNTFSLSEVLQRAYYRTIIKHNADSDIQGVRDSPPQTDGVTLKKYPAALCSRTYEGYRHLKQGFDEKTQMCFGNLDIIKDTCPGDSGGPIQIKNKKIYCMYTVVGLTSVGIGCGLKDQPGIYTRVSNYVSWIESIVWPN